MKKTVSDIAERYSLIDISREGSAADSGSGSNLELIRRDNKFLVVCLGLGRDSVAMLLLLKQLELRPDLIVFSDLGMEKDDTYAFLPVLSKWLKTVGFPPVDVLRSCRNRDESFEHHLFRLGIFPSLAYGNHRCSVMWKIEVIEQFLTSHPAIHRALVDRREIVKCIGFEAGEEYRADRNAKHAKDAGSSFQSGSIGSVWFPLIEQGLTLSDCIDLIRKELGQVPPKSSCYLCPAMQVSEIEELEISDPAKFFKALVLEHLVQTNSVVIPGRVQGLKFGAKWSELPAAERYLPAVSVAADLFSLARTVEDGVRVGDGWRPKAHRVDVFLRFFSNRRNLESFLRTLTIPPAVARKLTMVSDDSAATSAQLDLFASSKNFQQAAFV